MSEVKIDYRSLKDKWKQQGEIPVWYSTNALQFFMEKYSYKGESVKSRDKAIAKYLASHAPKDKKGNWIYPDWWNVDLYTAGLTYEEVFFNAIWDGYLVPSTPLKANGGLPERGMSISCSLQHLSNSVSSKSFVRGELEQLIKNAHGCSVVLDDWISEGTIYSDDGNISAGIIPIIEDFQKVTEEICQSSRRGSTVFGVDVEHGDFWKVADYLFEHSANINIAWHVRDTFIERLKANDAEANSKLSRIIEIRMQTGKGYLTKIDTMNRNKAQTFKNLGLEVKQSNLCNETNLITNQKYTASCVILNANLSLWDFFPEHIFQIQHIMQDCNVSGYLEQIDSKTGYSRLFLSKIYDFTKDFRSVGSGTLGLHTLFMQRGIVVGSIPSFQLNNKIFKRMQQDTNEANIWLANVLGVPDGVKQAGLHLRNATTMFSPPTKSSTELARNSPSEGIGMETGLIKIKETVGGDIFRINTVFLDFLKSKGMYKPEVVKRIAENKGSCQDEDWMTDEEKAVFRIAFEVPMDAHLDLCSQRQQFFDQQQSINLYFSGSDDEEYIGEMHKKALLDEGINALYYCYSSRGGVYKRIKECDVCT